MSDWRADSAVVRSRLKPIVVTGWACDCREYPHDSTYCPARRPITTTRLVDPDWRPPALTDAQKAYRRKHSGAPADSDAGKAAQGVTPAEPVRRGPIVPCRPAIASELSKDAAEWLAILWRKGHPALATYAKGWATKRFEYPAGTTTPDGTPMVFHDDPWPMESLALRAPGLFVACWLRLEGDEKWKPSTRMALWKGRIYRVSVNEIKRLVRSL